MAVDAVTGPEPVDRQRLFGRIAATLLVLAAVLIALDRASLGGFEGLLFDGRLPPW